MSGRNKQPNLKRLEKLLEALDIKVFFRHGLELRDTQYIYKGNQDKYNRRYILVESPKWNNLLDQDLFKFEQKAFIQSVLHELGHFLVAPPRRRKLKDYGIPDTEEARESPKWIAEEDKANIIEGDLAEYIGVTPSATMPKVKKLKKDEYKDWYEVEGKVIAKTVINLAESL